MDTRRKPRVYGLFPGKIQKLTQNSHLHSILANTYLLEIYHFLLSISKIGWIKPSSGRDLNPGDSPSAAARTDGRWRSLSLAISSIWPAIPSTSADTYSARCQPSAGALQPAITVAPPSDQSDVCRLTGQ